MELRKPPKEELQVPRYGKIPKREIAPDAVHDSILLQRFINKIMIGGKKSKAEKIVYVALEEAAKKLEKKPLEIFELAIENVRPLLEVKARRVGGATYQVPVEVVKLRGQALAMKWVIAAARERKGQTMIKGLAAELADASNKIGVAMKKREDAHKTAAANKAFAHFRW